MTDGIGGRFDKADVQNLEAQYGGNLRSDAARLMAKSRILMDGKVENSEIDAYEEAFYDKAPEDFDVAAFDPVSGVTFGEAETNLDTDIRYLKEFQPLEGSKVTGRPPQFSDPLAMLARIGQVDALAATTNDHDRCGAAAWVSEMVLRGPEALQQAAQEVMAHPHVPQAIKDSIKDFTYNESGLTARALHLLMEGQYHTLRRPGDEPGIDNRDMDRRIVANGGQTGHIEETFTPPVKGQRSMVMLRAGGGADDRNAHYVVMGRDRKGFYVIDPGMNKTHRFKNDRDLKAFMATRTLALDDLGRAGKQGFYVMPLSGDRR